MYINETGLPSPSDVLRPWVDPQWFTAESRERGAAVHAACAAHLRGGFALIRPEYRGYFDGFRRWCDKHRPEPLLVEERLKDDEYGFSGQPDFICQFANGEYWLVDVKTGAPSRAWPIQLAAYHWLAKDVPHKGKRTALNAANLQLMPDGSFDFMPVPSAKMGMYFLIFINALNLHNHFL